MNVKVSYGTAIKLGLLKKKIDCFPTTIYLMIGDSCTGRCLFCAQANNSGSQMLSRVTWPEFSLEDVLKNLKDERVCIQCLNYKTLFNDVLKIVENIDNEISVSAQPFSGEELKNLSKKIERVGISLDCANKDLFEKIKPTYSWNGHWRNLERAAEIFGEFGVTSHLIVGLGETEEDLVRIIQKLHSKKITPSLFAFTPLKGTPLETKERPSLKKYRKIQLAYHLITEDISNNFKFKNGNIINFGVKIGGYIENPVIYTTRGCPKCNRPYFNESPGGTIYNYPHMPDKKEMEKILETWR